MYPTKICIVGAGPAGAAAALQLNKEGIDCIIVDEAVFPRDKVCGDGLSGKVLDSIKKIDPAIAVRLQNALFKVNSWGVCFTAPSRQQLDLGYRPDFEENITARKEAPIGYVCKRTDFDHFLIEEVKRCEHVRLFEGVKIHQYSLEEDGYVISGSNGFQAKASLVIIANGAHSSFTKKIAGIHKEPKHYMAGVRAYFSNVSGMSADNFIELHFLRNLLPGYFWIFPLPNGQANVGLCMLSDDVSRRKMNLKKELMHIIQRDPVLKERFQHATAISGIEGYGLPLGSKKRKISGERYLLAGDAAYLIDPFTGEGIGNALCSGRIAGEQAAAAIKAGDCSAAALESYDASVYRALGGELKLSTRLQKLAAYPWLFNALFKVSARNQKVKELMSSMFYELDIRKKLTRPSFYLKLLLNK